MLFNGDKCKDMHFGHNNLMMDYTLNSKVLNVVCEEKDMGVVISNDLKAVLHCNTYQNIVMICFPPHSTHRMQPLDRTVYGPMKAAYNRECDKWMTSHVGQRIRT